MGIAHGAAVDAALDGAAGIARHAAGVGVAVQQGVGLLPLIAGELAQAAADVFQVRGGIMLDGVHLGIVFAFQQQAVISTRNAAGAVHTLYGAGGGTPGDLAGFIIPPGNTAHGCVSLYGAAERTVPDGAGVDAGNAANRGTAAARVHQAGDVKILDHGAGLDITKQAQVGAAGLYLEAGDGVTVSQERAAEGGDGSEIHCGQVDVGGQTEGLALGPGVQGAVFGEFGKLFRGRDGDLIGGRPGRGLGQTNQQPYRQKEGGPFTRGLFHHCPPPFVSSGSSGGPSCWTAPASTAALMVPCTVPLKSASTTPEI